MPICRNFDLYLHAKNELNPSLLFWDVAKVLQTWYLEYFDNAWSYPSIMIVSPCRKLWCPKCWNQLAGNFDIYMHAKNQLPFWDIVKTWQSCCLGNFVNGWLSPSKIIVSISRKFLTSLLTFFLRYCKEIANLLFWVIGACLSTNT